MVIRDDSPLDVRLLKQKIAEAARVVEKLQTEKQALSKERDEAIALCDAAVQENEKLLLILSQYKRAIHLLRFICCVKRSMIGPHLGDW